MNPLDLGVKDLPRFLDVVDKKMRDVVPKNIGGLQRLLASSGKKLRPSLVIAVAHHSGKKIDEKVISAAAAVELVHLASLIHDDIIDDGTMRHGVPTINAKEGVDSAILAGDYLLAKGYSLASQVSIEAGMALAEAIMSLCEGQAYELADQFNTGRTKQSLLSAITGKTASMFIVSMHLGALVAGLDAKQIRALVKAAHNFGIYYQYMDDVSDFTQTTTTAGKSVGNDVREGNYTLPIILSLQGPNKNQLLRCLKNESQSSGIIAILDKDESLRRTVKEAATYKEAALNALSGLKNDQLSESLRKFIA